MTTARPIQDTRLHLMARAAVLGWEFHPGRIGPSTSRYEITWTWDRGGTRLVHAALWERHVIRGRRQRLRLVDVVHRQDDHKAAQVDRWLATYGTGQ